MAGCRMNPGCDSLKKRRPLARLAVMYTDQASLPDEVCRCNILSINRVHKVYGHFLPSVLDKNDFVYDHISACISASTHQCIYVQYCLKTFSASFMMRWRRLSGLITFTPEPCFKISIVISEKSATGKLKSSDPLFNTDFF